MLTLLFKAFSHFILRPPCKEGMGSERTGNLLQVTRIGSGRARCEPGPAWFHYSSQPPNKHHCKKIQICSFLFKVKSLSHVRLCDPVDCSLPGSSVHGIFQARVLEWVASSFSRGSSWPRDWTQVSHISDRCFNLWATHVKGVPNAIGWKLPHMSKPCKLPQRY